jgi:hypothetical protein
VIKLIVFAFRKKRRRLKRYIYLSCDAHFLTPFLPVSKERREGSERGRLIVCILELRLTMFSRNLKGKRLVRKPRRPCARRVNPLL